MAVRILEDHVVNQIAAGEVVERPASVVKELVENALDAGARAVRVTLRQGGCAGIHVADDGCGMGRDDALMATERHATSKIRAATDLEGVVTFGFRGEALPSIAAVSRFSLTTRPADAEVGTRVRIEGGKLLGVTDAGSAPGTEIDVRSLFFNLPARRKFLRARATELSHCVEAVVRAALPRPDVDFLVHHDGREVLRAPTAVDRAERARELLGSWGRSLRPIRFTDGDYAVDALVSPVGVHKSTPAGAMYLYVDGRYVRDPVLRRAVNEAYADLVPKGRYPVVVLDLHVPSGRVDVNVHPSKVEVRFHDPRYVGHLVASRLRDALRASGIERPRPRGPSLPDDDPRAPRLPLAGSLDVRPAPRQAAPPAPEPALPAHPDDDPRLRRTVTSARALGEPEPTLLAEPSGEPPVPPAPPEARVAPRADASGPEEGSARGPERGARRVLGGVGRYLLCEADGDLLVLDRRAARRAQVLRALRADRDAALGPPRRLLAPVLVPLPRAEVAALEGHVEALEALHVELLPFGPGEVALKALPALLARAEPRAFVADLAAALAGGGDALELATIVVARHAGADEEALDEAAALALLDADDPVEPAIGRVVLRIGADELARRFDG